ncbi:hypothetical protein BD414DRAFT_445984 [Trametes punicea]|nr:hypothetical protein BD414DRAFT_445984 [Trametes punicea]
MANRAVPLANTEFYDRFLPVPPEAQRPAKHDQSTLCRIFSVFKDAKRRAWKEEKVADTFVRCLGRLLGSELTVAQTETVNTHDLAPGMTFALSQHRYDADDLTKQKVDGAFFKSEMAPTDGRPHWADQLVTVEFKADSTNYDPYDDNPKKAMDSENKERKRVRGQIISYVELVFKKQHRTHLFLLVVIGKSFRVTRWDRSGTVVTPLVDYAAHPEVLYEFLWRVGVVAPETLGLDPTATPVRPDSPEYLLMDKMAERDESDLPAERRTVTEAESGNVFEYVRTAFRESLDEDWPRWKLSIPQEGGPAKEFLVGKPHFCAKGMAGRGTRGYVAIDLSGKTKRFVWLKDAWRTYYDLVESEGTVLQLLNRHKVVNVPTFVCHSDLPGQSTRTPEIWDLNYERRKSAQAAAQPATNVPSTSTVPRRASTQTPGASPSFSSSLKRARSDEEERLDMPPPPPPNRADTTGVESSQDVCPLRRHIHYRLVVEEIGRPLHTFIDGHHLVSVIYNCILAHQEAVEKTNTLHRDISGGNILIYPCIVYDKVSRVKRIALRGLLTDWELSKDIARGPRPRAARLPERTGTWQFMSVFLINEPKKAVDIPDELEAFFHVLLYYSVRYLRSNCQDVPLYMEHYFEAYRIENGQYQCGAGKSSTMENGRLKISDKNGYLQFNSPIDRILQVWLGLLKAHYEVRRYEQRRKATPPSSEGQGASQKRQSYGEVDEPPVVNPNFISVLSRAPTPHPPSPDVHLDAQRLATHQDIVFLVYMCLQEDPDAGLPCPWPLDDKVEDQYPPTTKKRLATAPTELLERDSRSKRRKVESIASFSTASHSVPVRSSVQSVKSSTDSRPDSGYASGSVPLLRHGSNT